MEIVMERNCATCGSPLKDNSKFCEVCGTPVPVQTLGQERFCVQCGNLLKPGTKFCEICGREVAVEKPKSEPQIKEPTTMDELVIPEITETTFASNRELNSEKFDGFEAAVMPDSRPAQPAAPAPTPEFSMDTAFSSEQPKPAAVRVQAVPKSMPAQNNAVNQPAQNQFNNYPNPGMPIPTVGADGKEKKGSMVVPAILIILIVAVLVFDAVVFLGRKNDKDDSAEKSAAVIMQSDMSGENETCDFIL